MRQLPHNAAALLRPFSRWIETGDQEVQAKILEFESLLDDNLRAIEDDMAPDFDVIFDLPTLSAGLVSDPYFATVRGLSVIYLQAALKTTGSSNTVATVKIGSTTVGTLTLASGVKGTGGFVVVAAYMRPLTEATTDPLTVTCTTAGTGATGLVVTSTLRAS